MENDLIFLSLIIFLPAVAGLVICFLPKGRDELAKLFSMMITVAVFLLTAWLAIPGGGGIAGPAVRLRAGGDAARGQRPLDSRASTSTTPWGSTASASPWSCSPHS